MARKDARLMMEEAAAGNQELILVPSIAKEMDAWLSENHAQKDWTIFASRNK
jgi:3-hydroxyisobutyrate dehydrogenase